MTRIGNARCHSYTVASSDHDARLWDMSLPYPRDYSVVLPGHMEVVVTLHFLTDNQRVITAGQDGDPRPTCEIE